MEKDSENSAKLEKLAAPVPLEVPGVEGWKEVPLEENGEPLVAIGPFSGNSFDRIFTSSIYFGEREDSPYGRDTLHGALITTFARREVAEQVVEAEELLPNGRHIIVLDAYRTLEVQGSLYEQYLEALRSREPQMSEEELSVETQKFVSIPSQDKTRPSPHNTGGAIDVAIYMLPGEINERVGQINARIQEIGNDINHAEEVYKLEMERIGLIAKNAQMLNFGTKWDHGGSEAALNYFEILAQERDLTKDEEDARQNRRLLYNAMTGAGFEPYADEWWHYNSKKSQMGAKTARIDRAEYGAMELSKDDWHHELIRRQHLHGTERLTQMPIQAMGKMGKQIALLEVAAEAAQKIGSMQQTSLPKAAIIAPPEKEAA